MAKNKKLATKLAKNAFDRVKAEYSLEAGSKRMNKIFKEIFK